MTDLLLLQLGLIVSSDVAFFQQLSLVLLKLLLTLKDNKSIIVAVHLRRNPAKISLV